MKKLLSILGTVGLVATTGATVVACGGDKDPKTTGDFQITAKSNTIEIHKPLELTIKDFDKLSKTMENFYFGYESENNQTMVVESKINNEGVGAISFDNVQKNVKIFVVANKKESTLDEKPTYDFKSNELTIEVTNAKTEKQTDSEIIKLVINKQDDIKGFVDATNWTYNELFNIEGGHQSTSIIDKYFYEPALNYATLYYGYTKDQLVTFKDKMANWVESNISLIYINQKTGFIHQYTRIESKDENKELTLMDMYNVQFKADKDRDEKQNLTSLGIKFNLKQDIFDLTNAKGYWTFTPKN